MIGYPVILSSRARREQAKRLIDAAPENAVCVVKPGTRTLDQNAKLWAMCSDLARQKPEGREHAPEVWKCLLMHAAGHAVQFAQGLDGLPFPIGFRSSRLTKDQFSVLIETAYEYGARHGVRWTDTDDATEIQSGGRSGASGGTNPAGNPPEAVISASSGGMKRE